MVWGSYIEAAALMGHSIRILGENGNADVLKKAKEEARRCEKKNRRSPRWRRKEILISGVQGNVEISPTNCGWVESKPSR